MHVSSANGLRKINEQPEEKSEVEVFFEAMDSIGDIALSPQKDSINSNNFFARSRESMNYIVKKGSSIVGAYQAGEKMNLISEIEKGIDKGIYSAFTTKMTSSTENPPKTSLKNIQLNNLKSFNNSIGNDILQRISKNNIEEMNELTYKNIREVGNKYSPIAMNINNKIKSSPKINVNFNIKINCEKEGSLQTDTRKNYSKLDSQGKIIELKPLQVEEHLETIYDTPDVQLENEYFSENFKQIDKQYEHLTNFHSNNYEEENVSVKGGESVNISQNSENSIKRKITEIKFDVTSEIDLSYLRKNLKIIHVKSKQVSPENKNLRHLLELQNFHIDFQQIWIVKMSDDGRYLATGGKTGVLKIFEVLNVNTENFKSSYSNDDILSYLNFINEKPFRVYNDHSNDIIDICWSPTKKSILLTASLDHLVIMWDLNYEYPLAKFNHSSIVTCICFYPNHEGEEDEKFVTGCLDKIIRIWSSKKNKVLDYINIKEYITSISYLPTGDMIAVGTHNARCCVYDSKPKLRYNFSFTCRNRMGKYSQGRKITNIEFINRSQALITTNDSRIRLVNISDGKLIQKYKSHVNEQYMIRSYYDETNDLIISSSEDSSVYVWNKSNKESNDKKNYACEFFKPFYKDTSSCSILVNDECTANYLKKFYNLTTKVMIHNIIINASVGGRLQVLINCDDMANL